MWGLFILGQGAYHFHAYQAGTPTTAYIQKCVTQPHGQDCTGTWKVGGQSYSGPIEGNSKGSSVEVRAFGGTAYAPSSETASLLEMAVGLAFVVGLVVVVWWRRRTPR